MDMASHDDAGFDDPDDFLWGFAEIGRFIRRKPTQVAYMHAQGLFGDAVRKLGHKTAVGSKRRLQRLMSQPHLPAAARAQRARADR